jgi:hypothetical protein
MMAQLQHNMWVTNAKMAVLSVISGGGKWVEITIHADPPYLGRTGGELSADPRRGDRA